MTIIRRIAAIIVAAGSGTRAGGAVPKQFAMVAGRPMIAHAYDAVAAHPAIAETIVIVADGQQEAARAALGDVRLVVGGATRRESVANGLAAIGDATIVLIHDAARPFLPAPVIDSLIAALDSHEGAIPVLPVADTLAGVEDSGLLGDVVPRAGLHRVQTPQAFAVETLRRAHAEWPRDAEATDDAQMVRRLGVGVALVQGSEMLEKVTHPEDFAAADARAAQNAAYETRTAMGFDVHRLETGEELWLGGVLIPHDKGLSGHSDADVALHALTDALLGTIAAGDIGTHFPPSDPQWKGADSAQFLQHAARLIADKGGRIGFVDLTIMCEAPKIGPHRAAMTARIADLLGLSTDRVSVKATTTERLGFTGRGEGIAAQAVATISLPGSLPGPRTGRARVKPRMRQRTRLAGFAAMLAVIASPAAAQTRCITGPEAESLTLVALPDIISETGRVCAAQLPATSLIRRQSSALIGRYQAEADRAWPAARAAIVKLSDPAIDALLDSDFARPLLTSLLVPQIVGRIAPRDCGTIDRLVTLLEPLPPRNTAGIVVETLRYLKSQKARGGAISVAALPLCSGETH